MQNLATIFNNINFQPVQTAVEHNEIHTKPSRDTMQPMISAGKLFEPTITSSKKTMSENLKEEEILEPNPSSSRKSSILKNKQNVLIADYNDVFHMKMKKLFQILVKSK